MTVQPNPGPSRPAQLAPPRNGLATASLVLGIISIVASLLFLPAVVGLALGVAGAARAGRTIPPTGRGRAVAGIVLSSISLILGFVLAGALSGNDDTSSGTTQPAVVEQDEAASGDDASSDEPKAEPADKKPDTAAKSPGVGDSVRDGKFEFTVTEIEEGVAEIGDEYFGQAAQGQFMLVHLTVENIGGEAQYFDGNNVTAYDANGREFSADTEAAIYLDDSNSFLNDINPGNVVEGIVVFDVPADVELDRLELHDSLFSGGVEVQLR